MPWDDNSNEFDADEFDSDESGYGDDEDLTVPCPYCGRPIVEDIATCPYCENYITDAAVSRSSRPLWIWLTAILCLLMAIAWALPW